MRILDRYLLVYFGRMFVGVLIACAVLLVLTEIIDSFQDIISNNCPLGKAVLYFVLFLPYRLIQILPIVSILSVLFSIGVLAHNREMLAITCAGLSPTRVAAPLMIAGFVISVAIFIFGETVMPHTESMAKDIRRTHIEGKTGRVMNRNVFLKGEGQRFYVLRQYNNKRNEMIEPTVMDLDPETGQVVLRMTASRAVLKSKNDKEGGTSWVVEDAVVQHFNELGHLAETVYYDEPVLIPMEKNLHKYLSSQRDPEEMGAMELSGYIAMLETHGVPTDKYRTDYWLKVFFPFSCLVFVISGFAFAIRAQIGSIVIGFAQGILYALVFYAIMALSQAMGHRGVFNPFLAAFLPIVIYGALSFLLLRRSAYTMT